MTAQRALAVALEAIDFVRSEVEGVAQMSLPWPDIDEARGYLQAAYTKMPEVKALHDEWKARQPQPEGARGFCNLCGGEHTEGTPEAQRCHCTEDEGISSYLHSDPYEEWKKP